MNNPSTNTLSGKFALRSVAPLAAIAFALVAVAIAALRSIQASANTSLSSVAQDPSVDPGTELERIADVISSTSTTVTMIMGAVAVVGIVIALMAGRQFANKLVKSLGRVSGAALQSASAISEIDKLNPINGITAFDELPEIALHSGDEVEDLANSVAEMRRTVLDVAVSHARKRQHSADHFVNLGRRSQSLLREQMSLIEGMERDETSPENLHRLFQIDHLATRMRRTAESILVLADEASPRQLQRPVSLHQVVQAASSGIEHFDRVTISDVSGVDVPGAIAADLAHMIAELLENATRFAGHNQLGLVTGTVANDGYVLEVIDNGVGMEIPDLAMANERFARSAIDGFDPRPSPQLGLDVVARLARRHQVGVVLGETPGGGLTVRLHLPASAIANPAAPMPAAHASDWDPIPGAVLTAEQRESIDRAMDLAITVQPPLPTRPSPATAGPALAAAASQLPAGPIDAQTLAAMMDEVPNDA